MIETTITNPERHETVTADSQGRVSLGVDYAAHDVEIVVVDSEAHDTETSGVQQTVGAEPMTETERAGMLFVRSFGIDRECLKDDHAADVDEDGVDAGTVAPTDVDWSAGSLSDAENAARFELDDSGPEAVPFEKRLSAEPAAVTAEEMAGESVSALANDSGDRSAVLTEYVDGVQRVFGYDPTDELAHVRVDPDDGPAPVLFRDPDSDRYIVVAPWVDE